MFIFNIWLLPIFSGIVFSKAFFLTDKNYKNFLIYIVERIFLYRRKILRFKILDRITRKPETILKFSVILGALFFVIPFYLKVYLNVKYISN